MKPSTLANPTLGIMGGGQLAWLLSREAKKLNWQVKLIGVEAQDPAAPLGDEIVSSTAITTEEGRILALRDCDFVTFESEFVDFEAWGNLFKFAENVFPNPTIMNLLADKWEQKKLFRKFNLPTAPAELYEGDQSPPREGVAKWTKHGYDGYGNLLLPEKIGQWPAFRQKALEQNSRIYLENRIDFDFECSCIMGRDLKGAIFQYPLLITEQIDGICEWTYGPAESFFPELADKISMLGPQLRDFLHALNYVGVIAFELFYADGKLVVNEVAPRVHNSGHLTLDAFNVNQFQLHLQSAQEFSAPRMLEEPVVYAMKNMLGFESGSCLRNAYDFKTSWAHTYWYGKKELRKGRKLGHINGVFDEGTSVERMKECLRLAETESWKRIKE